MTYEQLLETQIKQNDKIVVMTAENRAMLRNLPPKIGAKFIDTGITEMTLVGSAAGLALRGRIPIAHALAAFITMRAFEFARTNVGAPKLPVKLVGSFAGFLSAANGFTHQAVEDIALMSGIPNMNIFCPADINELILGLPTIINSDNPYYIRYNDVPELIPHRENFEIGKAELFGKGNDLLIISYGFIANEAYKAFKIIEDRGQEVKFINMRIVKPIDKDVIINNIHNSTKLIVIEDHFEEGGLYSKIQRILFEKKHTNDILGINLKDQFFKPALLDEVLDYEGFTSEKIVSKIDDFVNSKR